MKTLPTLEDARAVRATRLSAVVQSLDDLIEFVRLHAASVDRADRAALRVAASKLGTWRDMFRSLVAAGEVASLAPVRLLDAVEAVAGASTLALNVLGARLARGGAWGESVASRELEDAEDDE